MKDTTYPFVSGCDLTAKETIELFGFKECVNFKRNVRKINLYKMKTFSVRKDTSFSKGKLRFSLSGTPLRTEKYPQTI
ncbi:hypothetical protein [Chryseobacterium turcicum]|uniref:Uncharacterized protein n=1 Tax=Chryseobacterium turcicum TaxID=2898076 RepID=A0A9Q3V473_9FLAO|nr:hypothetical protein [Chryseobacterium turcicum]MCD1116946.1 hypothetical protein [Chryseobacterium turcicum]